MDPYGAFRVLKWSESRKEKPRERAGLTVANDNAVPLAAASASTATTTSAASTTSAAAAAASAASAPSAAASADLRSHCSLGPVVRRAGVFRRSPCRRQRTSAG